MHIVKSSATDLTAELSDAAAAVRAATRSYRQALLSGDLSAAVLAKEKQLQETVRLERARWLVEGVFE